MMLPSAPQRNSALFVIEFCLTATTIGLAFAWPTAGKVLFARIEKGLTALARRKGLAVLSVGLGMLLLRLAILPVSPIPTPFVTDDFSFLLAADTFDHGRLTNPTPTMWTHFESIHITMEPTYTTMYFPGEALILAAGKVLFGNPWYGSLLASVLMCASLCWMLQAWLPPGWALLGGVLAILRLGLFSYWTNAYHAAGSLAALGGALMLGALPRLVKTGRFRYGLLMAIGLSILGVTRPYEGLLLSIPIVVVLARWVWKGKNRPPIAVLMRRAAVPLLVLIGVGAWMGYYDYRAFGNPLTLPYTVDRNTYALAPYFVWQHQRPEPVYRHAAMKDFYESELDYYKKIHSVTGFVPRTLVKVGLTFIFYAGFALLLPLVMIRRVFLDRRMRFLVMSVLVLAAGMVIEIFLLPHYVAPFTAVFYAIGLQAMRHLRVWKAEGKPVGLALVRMTVVLCVALAGLGVFVVPLHILPREWNLTWFGPEFFGLDRAQAEADLDKLPGGQLAIVRYSTNHDPSHEEWVYNSADIDNSKVVWAREMDRADNVKLIHYYANRKVWLVEPDAVPARILPYPMPAEAQAAAHSPDH